MATKRKRKRDGYYAVEVSGPTFALVDFIHDETKIPKRHLVNEVLARALRAEYAEILSR
jgi:hypothetical protein